MARYGGIVVLLFCDFSQLVYHPFGDGRVGEPFVLQVAAEVGIQFIAHFELVGRDNGVVAAVVVGGVVEHKELLGQRYAQVGHVFRLDLDVGLDAEAVVHRAASLGLEGRLQRVGHLHGPALLVAVAVVDGLYATSAGYVVFAHGDLHLAVVGHGQYVLHEALAVAALAHDDGTVEVLQAAAHNLAGRRRAAVDEHRQWYLGVFRLQAGVALGVFRRHLAFGLDHQGAARYPDIHYVDGLVHQAAAVAAQVEHHPAHVGLLFLQAYEGIAHVFGGVGRKFVELDVAVVVLLAHEAVVGYVGQLYLAALHRAVELAAGAFEAQHHVGAGLATHGRAHVGGLFAHGALSVDGHDAVARLDAGLGGRQPFVGLADVHRVAALHYHGAHAAVLPQQLQLHVFHLALGEVVGVGVERSQHGVDGHLDGLAGVYVVHIVLV